MSDFVIVTGDTVTVVIPSIVIPAAQDPQRLVGTSTDLAFGGAFVCLKGDELPPTLRGPLTYSEAGYSNPGMGMLQFTLTDGVNTTTVLKDDGAALLLKGAPFRAVFTVTTPVSNPNGQTGSSSPKNGTALFTTRNDCLTAD